MAQNLEQFAGIRDDVDAVHVRVPVRPWMRILGAPIPGLGALSQRTWRLSRALERVIMSAFSRHLTPDRFDVIHFTTPQRAYAVMKLSGRTTAKLVVNLDA